MEERERLFHEYLDANGHPARSAKEGWEIWRRAEAILDGTDDRCPTKVVDSHTIVLPRILRELDGRTQDGHWTPLAGWVEPATGMAWPWESDCVIPKDYLEMCLLLQDRGLRGAWKIAIGRFDDLWWGIFRCFLSKRIPPSHRALAARFAVGYDDDHDRGGDGRPNANGQVVHLVFGVNGTPENTILGARRLPVVRLFVARPLFTAGQQCLLDWMLDHGAHSLYFTSCHPLHLAPGWDECLTQMYRVWITGPLIAHQLRRMAPVMRLIAGGLGWGLPGSMLLAQVGLRLATLGRLTWDPADPLVRTIVNALTAVANQPPPRTALCDVLAADMLGRHPDAWDRAAGRGRWFLLSFL